MFHGVCYLFGNQEMPLIHGTVTFREERTNYICMDVHIQGVQKEYLYGIRVGQMLFPPVAADEQGEISITFCRKGDFEHLFAATTVTLFRYSQRISAANMRRQNVASGRVQKVIFGGKDYAKIK